MVEVGAYVAFTQRLVKLNDQRNEINEGWNKLKAIWNNQVPTQSFDPSEWKIVYEARKGRHRVEQLGRVSWTLTWRVMELAVTVIDLLEMMFSSQERRKKLILENLGSDLIDLGLKVSQLHLQRDLLTDNAHSLLQAVKEVMPGEIAGIGTFLESLLSTSAKVDKMLLVLHTPTPTGDEDEEEEAFLPAEPMPPLAEYTLE